METFNAICHRVSVREYDDRPVSKELLKTLVDAGRRAPTARGTEPWEFVIVQDKEVLQKIGEIANSGSFIKKAAACIAVFCQDTKYYIEDGSAATENILLVAADNGLGACWVAGDKKPYADQITRLFDAPSRLKLLSLISVGWPIAESRQSKKRGLKEVIHWEKF